jgi:hypothetical protein
MTEPVMVENNITPPPPAQSNNFTAPLSVQLFSLGYFVGSRRKPTLANIQTVLEV